MTLVENKTDKDGNFNIIIEVNDYDIAQLVNTGGAIDCFNNFESSIRIIRKNEEE